jgi:hypothetical protein
MGHGVRFGFGGDFCGRHSFAARFVCGTRMDGFWLDGSFRREVLAIAIATIAPAATAPAPPPSPLPVAMRLHRSFAVACNSFTRLLQ